MKKRAFIISCVVLCASIGFSSPQEQEYYNNAFARLNYVKGDVYIQRAEDMGYEEGTVNLPIVGGDKLGTRDGRAEIHFGRKNFLRVDKYTQIDFVKLPQRGDDVVRLHLFAGNAYLRVNSLNIDKEFEIHSPDGSFYVLEEGLYRFEVRDNQETAIIAVEGSIEVAGEEGFEIVRGGEILLSAGGFFRSGPEYLYAGNEDMFSEWNRGRDVFHNRYVRTRYLPVEMYEYEAELDYYGRWAYERPYGYVWVPDVYHSSWRPYYHGRWIWYPICGWTWCSYEPWGWCVSHYGRWHWRIGLGWYWIPTTRWGPAWVHWYTGYDYIGWSPLSYYNRPVVIVNNHFYGRYNDAYYPTHSRAFTVLRKDQLSARQVSKVALGQSVKSRLGKISLSSHQPSVQPASSRIQMKGSAASKALTRTNLRPVGRSYSSDPSIRSSGGKSLDSSASSSRISTRPGTIRKSGTSQANKSMRITSSARTSASSSQSARNRSLRSAIKTYPSRNRSVSRTSGTLSSGTKRSVSGIKTYPSRQSSVQKSRNSSTANARTNSSRTSRSYTSTLKRYTPRTSTSTPSRSIRQSGRSSSSTVKRYSSQSRSRISPNSSRISSRGQSAYRSTSSRSSSSISSRSSSRIRSSSSSKRSYAPSRVTSSRSSSSSRSVKSTSRTQSSRSSPSRSSASRSSSRSTSTTRVKKK